MRFLIFFTGVVDGANYLVRVLDYVRQNIAVVFALAFYYSLRIMFFALTILFCTYTLCRILMTSLFAEFSFAGKMCIIYYSHQTTAADVPEDPDLEERNL